MKLGVKIGGIFSTLLILLALNGCSVQLISDYDRQTQQQMSMLAKKIDRLYIELSMKPAEQRQYQSFINKYIDIQVDLRALENRQQVRSMNELTLKQVELTTQLWLEDQSAHQRNNTVSDFIIKRRQSQYRRIFIAMIRGEAAKQSL